MPQKRMDIPVPDSVPAAGERPDPFDSLRAALLAYSGHEDLYRDNNGEWILCTSNEEEKSGYYLPLRAVFARAAVPAAVPPRDEPLESIARIALEAISGDSADHYNALRDILAALATGPQVVGHPMLTPEEMDRYGAWWLSEAAAAVPPGGRPSDDPMADIRAAWAWRRENGDPPQSEAARVGGRPPVRTA